MGEFKVNVVSLISDIVIKYINDIEKQCYENNQIILIHLKPPFAFQAPRIFILKAIFLVNKQFIVAYQRWREHFSTNNISL